MEKERKTPNLIKVMKGLSFLWTIWNVFFHSFSLVFMFCWTTSKGRLHSAPTAGFVVSETLTFLTATNLSP
jgi:hypothetical protein